MQGVLYAAIGAVFIVGLFFVDSYRRRGSGRATHDAYSARDAADREAALEESTSYAESARRVAEAEAASIRQLAQNEADSQRRGAQAEAEALRRAAESDAASAAAAAKGIRGKAETDAEELIAAARRSAEAEVGRLTGGLREAERDLSVQSVRLDETQERLDAQAVRLETEAADLDRALRKLGDRERDLSSLEEQLAARVAELDQREAEQGRALERVAGLSVEEAKAELLSTVEAGARRDAATLVRSIENEARTEGTERARAIVVEAVQRVASEQTTETVVSVLHLPGDEMKGRIIGREGRNIRAFEAVTGVNVIIDDTPEAVLLSCFDPVRREIGRLTLEKLIAPNYQHNQCK